MNRKLCAPADRAQSWESIDWKKAEAYVKKLQMRIVKAQKDGHYNKVKTLQWLLTHSFYAKALAVKRVTSNKGKNTAGVDHELWTIFENTHDPIIDQQTFDLVQKIRGNVRRYPDGWGEAAPLTGLLYCADCGGKMYVHRTNNGKRISQWQI